MPPSLSRRAVLTGLPAAALLSSMPGVHIAASVPPSPYSAPFAPLAEALPVAIAKYEAHVESFEATMEYLIALHDNTDDLEVYKRDPVVQAYFAQAAETKSIVHAIAKTKAETLGDCDLQMRCVALAKRIGGFGWVERQPGTMAANHARIRAAAYPGAA